MHHSVQRIHKKGFISKCWRIASPKQLALTMLTTDASPAEATTTIDAKAIDEAFTFTIINCRRCRRSRG